MAARLDVQVEDRDGTRVLLVSGEVDLESSPRVLNAIREGLSQASALKLDLRDVSYIDSSGIAVLIQGLKLARRDNPSYPYALLNASQQVISVIELSQLRELFDFESSEAEG